MRWLFALAALALLAAWVSIGGNDGRLSDNPSGMLDVLRGRSSGGLVDLGGGSVDVTTPDRIRGRFDSGRDIRVAGGEVVAEGSGSPTTTQLRPILAAPPEGGIDEARSYGHMVPGETFEAYLTIYCCLNGGAGAYCPVEEGGQATASGLSVSEVDPETGARMVACSLDWPFGAQFLVAGEFLMVCRDRGSAVVSPKHLDIHFYDCGDQEDPAPGTGWAWLQQVGTQVEVEVFDGS